MSIYKRADTYHTDVTVNGTRYRQSLDTGNWQEAQRKQKELIAAASNGKAAGPAGRGSFAGLSVKDALEKFIAGRLGRVAERTSQIDKERTKVLCRIMGDTLVRKIDADVIRQYQDKRKAEGVANRTVNLEVTLIRQVLKKGKRWSVIADDVLNLPENQTVVGRALSKELKLLLFQTAASRPEWDVAYCAAVIAANTTCRKVEVLNLKWESVDLFASLLSIRRSKTEAGNRTIPLTDEALLSFARLRRRAEAFGGGAPTDYVFPACENARSRAKSGDNSNGFDFRRPQRTFRTAWRSLVKAATNSAADAAAEEAEGRGADEQAARKQVTAQLAGFRFHDLRHQAITEMAEAGVPEAAMQSIAGHLSKKMLDHYSHVRMAAKRDAVKSLGGGLIAPELDADKATGKVN